MLTNGIGGRFGRVWRQLLGVGVLLLGLGPGARATHIVGGEMELQYRSGTTYTLVLNLYFDAINGNAGALDQQVSAGIFEKGTNQRMTDVTLPLTSNTFVSYTNPACTQPSLSTRKLVYSRDITLAPTLYTSTDGYYAAVGRCCRNGGISNILNSLSTGQTFYLEFPAVVRNGQPFLDSTPRIFPPLGDYACLGELFYYDFGGQDADADSLAYSLATPLNSPQNNNNQQASPAPYSQVSWTTGLSELRQMPGAPTMDINARTGRLSVRPTSVGLFVFGIRCAEYRRGIKIGETRRDFQLFVLSCAPNQKPRLQLSAGSSPRPYAPGRDTLRLAPGQNLCLQVRYTDPDLNSRLTLSVRPVNFSGPVPTLTGTVSGTVRGGGGPDTLQATLCFSPCLDTQGQVRLVDVLVADNGCSLPKLDTVRIAFTSRPVPNARPVLTTAFLPDNPTAAVVRVPLGSVYTTRLLGADADNNPLVISAAAQGFDLAAAGMDFTAQNGAGQATGNFRWLPTCEAARLGDELTVRFQLQESATCPSAPQLVAVRFVVGPPVDTVAFAPPNVITPNGDGKNDAFEMPSLPPDYCDARFAGIRIYSRWGREVYQSAERTFRWGGAGVGSLYYYLITYTNGRRYKGWVEVVQ